MQAKLTNAVLFQLCWFASVLCAANGLPWVGPVTVCAWLVWHLQRVSAQRAHETKLVVGAALFGWTADSILISMGLVVFPAHAQLGLLSPIWMVGLWAGLSATLSHSLAWLRGHWLIASIHGAIAGPAAYRAGQALGALSLDEPAAYLALAAVYGAATPILLALSPTSSSRDNSSTGEKHKAESVL